MIQRFADWLVYDIFGLDASTALGEAINFFFYDTIKILILLFFISVIMGIINAYFPIERLRNYLTSRKLYGLQYFFAALFGAITPFCSCSSIPLFIGFVKGGIPLGVTFAYLITSPLVNEVAVAMFIGTFGLRITSIYVISGILLGMVGGFILGKMKLEPYLSDWVKQIQQNSTSDSGTWEKEHTPFFRRLPIIMQEAWGIVKGVLLYILIGIGIGAFMHGYVPEEYKEHEKEILIAQAKNDPKNANKPENIIEKMITGRLAKELKEICLLEQEYVKAENKETVAKYLEMVSKEVGTPVELKRFVRFETGEGLEKKNEDFAAEVAAQMNA